MSPHPLSRRDLLLAASLCLGACALSAKTPTYTLTAQPALWPIELPLSALEPHGLVIVSREQGPSLLVTRGDDGGYTAVTLLCTHRACALLVRHKQLACPCHGSRYELTGELLRGPAQTPLTKHRITLKDATTLQITES